MEKRIRNVTSSYKMEVFKIIDVIGRALALHTHTHTHTHKKKQKTKKT
jgi:hypothetical protein